MVKTHLLNIYAKLGVSDRAAAVAEAFNLSGERPRVPGFSGAIGRSVEGFSRVAQRGIQPAVQDCLAGQPGSDLLIQIGHDEGLVPAQDGGLGFDVGPVLEPAVQALLLALLQVVPQAGQSATGVELGYCV